MQKREKLEKEQDNDNKKEAGDDWTERQKIRRSRRDQHQGRTRETNEDRSML